MKKLSKSTIPPAPTLALNLRPKVWSFGCPVPLFPLPNCYPTHNQDWILGFKGRLEDGDQPRCVSIEVKPWKDLAPATQLTTVPHFADENLFVLRKVSEEKLKS